MLTEKLLIVWIDEVGEMVKLLKVGATRWGICYKDREKRIKCSAKNVFCETL